jgi:uncharacterized protein YndB with AHSA1/START domain
MANKLSVSTPTDREVLITRVFDAPRRLVYDAWTKPEFLKRWLHGLDNWTLAVCDMDVRPGGSIRWVVTLTLTEQAGKTTCAMTVLYSSLEARDAAIKTGMTDGMEMGYARLDKLLAEMA